MPILESSADQRYMLNLPTVSFRVISDDKSMLVPAGVHGDQSRSYGFNDFSDFERPEHYIRYIEPIESELRVQVEYDMDEQDQEWLDAVNLERKKDQSGPIAYEVFEIIMDKLEKEWFELLKRIPQPASHLPVEDSKCAVCDDGEGENSNAIVFCDGCNLAVHQDCYGVPYIPEGQWLCRKCTVSPENPVSCLFCPNEGGAFKQTSTGHWCHLLCSMWIPELTVGNAIYMEPVDGVESVPKNRWKLVCSLCRERVGACIQCDNKTCFTAFHVTCARQLGYLQTMKSVLSDGALRAFCEKHLPDDYRYGNDDETASEHSIAPPTARRRQGSHNLKTPVTSKSARAHAKSYRPGPPIVPQMIIQNLLAYVAKINIRKRHPLIERICRYWSLKREARRGAPLLKRLHLEPWTANAASRQETEADKTLKLKFLKQLRRDLDLVRTLAEQVRKREKEKLRQSQAIKDVVDGFIFPHYARLRLALEKISAMDRTELFLHPVNRVEVPDYFEIIKEPMCWLYIDEKLEKNGYRNIADFQRDISLVCDNAIKYNAPDSHFNRIAKRIKSNAQPLLDDLSTLKLVVEPNGEAEEEGNVGDLEPSEVLLRALTHDTGEGISRDYLASIFASEMEKPRPPTPAPPTSPPEPVKKERRVLTNAERRHRWEERQSVAKERTTNGRTTRAAKAVEKAFKQEAGVPGSSDAEISGMSRGGSPSRGEDSSRSSRRRSGRGAVPPTIPEESVASVNTDDTRRQSRLQRGVERRDRERALDLVTLDVDEKDQFSRFNVGWIMPEGSKRRRTEKQVSTKPESSSSKLSLPRRPRPSKTSETPIEETIFEERTPEPTGQKRPDARSGSSLTPPPESSPLSGSEILAGGVQTPQVSARRAGPSRKRKASPEAELFGRESKRVKPSEIFELGEEDEEMTPTPEKSAGRARPSPQKRGVLADIADATPTGRRAVAMGRARAAKGEEIERAEPGSELTDDAEVDDGQEAEEEEEKEEEEEEDQENDEEEEDPFPPGTLVWAKQLGYPFFPAETVDPSDENMTIPPIVIQSRAKIESENHVKGQKTWLVQFFDRQKSYGWIPASKLDMLGENDHLDATYINGKEKGKTKGFKNTNMKNAVRLAYRDAIAQAQVSPGGEEEEVLEEEE